MEFILALDFDGTLYRLEDHDSEEMLMSVAASTEEEKRTMEDIIRFLDGGGNPNRFEVVLRDMMVGKPISLVRKAIDRIMPLANLDELSVLRDIVRLDNVHLHILSCGTDLLIEEFLRRTGLLEYTEGIHAKKVVHDGKTFQNFIWSVTGPDSKRIEICKLKAKHPDAMVVAVGDGHTDEPMLKSADLGLLIGWPGGRHCDMEAERISSFSELRSRLESIPEPIHEDTGKRRSWLSDDDIRGIMEDSKAVARLAGSCVTDPYIDDINFRSLRGELSEKEAIQLALDHILNED